MNYCGIDLAGVSSYVYVTDGEGRKRSAGRAIRASHQLLSLPLAAWGQEADASVSTK